jgi:hypothetical protein
MSDHPNDDFKIEPVNGLPDLLQRPKGDENRTTPCTRGAFEDWLIEYRDRLAKILQDRANNINSS